MKLDLRAPHTVYKSSEGKRLQGVTTILGVLAKPALLGWYASMERDGMLSHVNALDYEDRKDLRSLRAGLPVKANGTPLWFAEAKRDKAADLGTVTHARIQAHRIGDSLDPHGIPADIYEASIHGLSRYVEWEAKQGFKHVASERKVIYDDGKMAYGGTADGLDLDRDSKRVLLDIKTSKASSGWPYDETFGQVVAYAEANANDPAYGEDIDRIIVVRVGKTLEDIIQVVELTAEQRSAGWELFKAAYAASEAKRALDKLR